MALRASAQQLFPLLPMSGPMKIEQQMKNGPLGRPSKIVAYTSNFFW